MNAVVAFGLDNAGLGGLVGRIVATIDAVMMLYWC